MVNKRYKYTALGEPKTMSSLFNFKFPNEKITTKGVINAGSLTIAKKRLNKIMESNFDSFDYIIEKE